MGTTWTVRAVPPPGADQSTLQAAVEEELAAVVADCSHWDPTSVLTRFNAAPAGTWGLSDGLWTVLDAGLNIADDTNGAFDPTLGALVDLWGFGPPGPRADAPSDAAIEAALAASGWQKLRLNRDAQAAIQPGGMRLDLSGIAKGHAVDRVSDRLTREGATSHLVEIGGELKGVGVKPEGSPWWVEIERPPGGLAPRTVVALYDLAMATTGDYRRVFEASGVRYPHTLDGRTGRPIDNGLVSVTVLDASALRADALATALTVMGAYEGPEYADAMGLNALFVERTAYGLVERMTPAFRAMLEEEAI